MSYYTAGMIELQQCRPDLIFMDIGAPGMDGVKLCRELKQQNIYAGIPVVMMYRRTQKHEKLLCLNIGCQGVLSKPLERTAFLSMGRKFLPSV
jgi:CheY-like chemotaxis protein